MANLTCSIIENGKSCGKPAEKRGWCGMHYQRWRRTATTDLVPKVKPPRDNFAYFWPKVNKDGPIPEHCPALGPCWVWTAGRDESGYAVFNVPDENGRWRRTRAHRWLLGQMRGKPLTRDVVGEEDGCHHCDNPPCVNPDHLYVGTRKQNLADAVNRRRLSQLKRETCPHGHPIVGVSTQRGGMKRRYCKTCARADSHRRRTVNRTRCKNGHLLEGGNVLLCKNGTRKCRICDAARLAKAHPGFTYSP